MMKTAAQTSLKNEFASFQTLPCLFRPAQFAKCRRPSVSWSCTLKDFIQVQKEKGKLAAVCSQPS